MHFNIKIYPQLVLILLTTSTIIKAQYNPELYKNDLSKFVFDHSFENIYVNTDRSIYSSKDTIWYKVYLLDNYTLQAQNESRSVYIELIDNHKKIKIRNLIQVKDGFGKGDFILDKHQIEGGLFTLRAYTDYQRNFNHEFYFSKKVVITELFNQQFEYEKSESEELKAKNPTQKIDLQFLPEGGNLILNRSNTIAFIAKNSFGQPIDVSGWILDSKKNKVTRFSSEYQGMGKTMLIPKTGEVYTAIVDKFPDQIIQLPQASDNIHFTASNREDKFINIGIWSQVKKRKRLYLVNSSKGVITFYLSLDLISNEKKFRLNTNQFSMGINQLTLLDDQMTPIAERLVFIKKESPMQIDLETSKLNYSSREKVHVKVKTSHNNKRLPAHLSITAVNSNQVIPLEQYPQNILSYLLLDSELKGTIPNPSFFFKDDSVATKAKLDLLMLTHGWRKYNWNTFNEKLPSTTFKKQI